VPGSATDIWTIPLEKGGTPTPFLSTKAIEWQPRISPDGRYVAYVSNESGGAEIYLTKIPTGEGKWQVSVNHGAFPNWSRAGYEIVYRNDDTIMSVSVKTDPTPILGTPQILFKADEKGVSVRQRAYDLTPDGKHFITVKPLEKPLGRDQIVVVTNWHSEFDKAQ
jgi:Tol biopolymer transport system component